MIQIAPVVIVDPRTQHAVCTRCHAETLIPIQRFRRPDLRLQAVQEFEQQHEDCRRLQHQATIVAFWCRPFRPALHRNGVRRG